MRNTIANQLRTSWRWVRFNWLTGGGALCLHIGASILLSALDRIELADYILDRTCKLPFKNGPNRLLIICVGVPGHQDLNHGQGRGEGKWRIAKFSAEIGGGRWLADERMISFPVTSLVPVCEYSQIWILFLWSYCHFPSLVDFVSSIKRRCACKWHARNTPLNW